MGVKLKGPNGMDAMELKWVKYVDDEDVLRMKGVALGAMPITIDLTAENIYGVYKMIDKATIKSAIKLLRQGKKLTKAKDSRTE